METTSGRTRTTRSRNCDCDCCIDNEVCCKLSICCLVIGIIGAIITVIIVFAERARLNGPCAVNTLTKGLATDEFDTSQPPIQPQNETNVIWIRIQSANTKEKWMNQIANDFMNNEVFHNGKRIKVEVFNTGSSLKKKYKPTIWSPQDTNYLTLQEEAENRKLVSNPELCTAVTAIPVGVAMWREMATALGWPNTPIGFDDIGSLAINSRGWESISPSVAKYKKFKYAHGHPGTSNSGRLSVVTAMSAFTPNATSTVAGVTKASQNAEVKAIIQSVVHLGKIDTDLLARMRDHGQEYLHAVANYESNVINWNIDWRTNLQQWNDNWVFIYLNDGSYWMQHPLCILDAASWVTPEEASAAQVFVDYATQRPQLEKLLQYGIRPATFYKIDLTCCGSTINLQNGAIIGNNQDNIPSLSYPPTNVMSTVINLWKELKPPGAFALVIDTSGSMSTEEGDCTRIAYAKAAVTNFVDNADPDDWLYVMGFGKVFPNPGFKKDIEKKLKRWIRRLSASGGTPLYAKMLEAWDKLNEKKVENTQKEIDWNYALIAMTDGRASDDSKSSQFYSNKGYGRTAAQTTSSDIIHIFPILFGKSSFGESSTLGTLARNSGGKLFKAEADNIADIYFQLSLEL